MREATTEYRIGLAGFGEVGRSYASALLERGIALQVYHPAPRAETIATAQKMGVSLTDELNVAFESCDLVLNVASGSSALDLAQAVAPYLKQGAVFADLSAASPADLRAAACYFPND